MILESLNKSFKNLEEELRSSQNPKIISSFQDFDYYVSKNQYDEILQTIIKTAFIKTVGLGVWSYLYFEDKIIEQFDYYISHIYESQQTITIKLSFHDYPQELYRIMKLPYMIKLDDFCYSVLAGLMVQECKQFALEIKHTNKHGQEIAMDEMNKILSAYHIVKDTHIKLYYDFDEEYLFDIEVLDIENHSNQNIEIIEANGYGVWESAKNELWMYYHDKLQFINMIHYKGLDIDDFFTEAFDCLYINQYIKDNFKTLKIKYNIKYREEKLFYEYLPFFTKFVEIK